jgi:sugar lactone lactonase YvrE
VGVLALDGTLYVSDQEANRIVRAPLSAPANAQPFVANIEAPDLMVAGPAGTIFVGGKLGVVYRVARDGSFTKLAGGFRSVRGVAYDAAGKRLFVAERRGREPAAPPMLHELPVGD